MYDSPVCEGSRVGINDGSNDGIAVGVVSGASVGTSAGGEVFNAIVVRAGVVVKASPGVGDCVGLIVGVSDGAPVC